MTSGKRRTIVEFESFERTVIRFRPGAAASVFCRACGALALHLSVRQAALVLSCPEAAVFRAAQSGRLHATETASGALLVCASSLADLKKEKDVFGGIRRWDL